MTREEAKHRMELFAINITGAAAKGNPLAIKDLDAVNMAIEALQERPKGRYIPDNRYQTQGNCSRCNGNVTILNNFCPNCGADMRESEQE